MIAPWIELASFYLRPSSPRRWSSEVSSARPCWRDRRSHRPAPPSPQPRRARHPSPTRRPLTSQVRPPRRKRPRTTARPTTAVRAAAPPTRPRPMRPASRQPRRRPRRPDRSVVKLVRVTRVYVEVGGKRAFASAADWPGWSRSGKDEATALANLAAYAPRYAPVAKIAKIDFPKAATDFQVVERLNGNATTDFGAPGIPAKEESTKRTPKQIERMVALLQACWKYLDDVRAHSPQELRKGPRGGGRDRDK